MSDLDQPVSGWVYDALQKAHAQLSNVLSRHGCPQGEEMAPWLDAKLSTARAALLGIETWQDWSDGLTTLCKHHGWNGQKLRQEWLAEQLDELKRRRENDV